MDENQKPGSVIEPQATTGSDLQAADSIEDSPAPPEETTQTKKAEPSSETEQDVASQDEAAMVAGVEAVGKVSIWLAHIKNFPRVVWRNKKYRYLTLTGVLLFFTFLFGWPTTRYATFNTVGFRANVMVKVIDEQTQSPVIGAIVATGNTIEETNDEGFALLENIRLGQQTFKISKSAYGASVVEATIGFGSNELTDLQLAPIGTQFAFTINDWLSNEPIKNARVSFESTTATTDDDGKVILSIPPNDKSFFEVEVTANNYHDVKTEIDATSTAENSVLLVANPSHYYMSKRSGNYDLYRSRLDGKDEELIAPGTGLESNQIRFSMDPSNRFGALVSTRTGTRDTDGGLLDSLHIVEVEAGKVRLADESRRIQLIDWVGSKIIYVKIKADESTFSPNRHLLLAYDTNTNKITELEASNHFNDVRVLQGKIYYAADDSHKQSDPKPLLYRINPDATNRTVIVDRQSWTMFQQGFNEIVVNTTKNGWFTYRIDTGSLVELSGQPSNLQERRYFDGPGAEKSAWVDERDGKGVLLVYNSKTGREDVVFGIAGLKEPVRWIDDDKLIFRVENSQETADYIVDLDGGEPQKINDVANILGSGRWFYY